MRTMKGFKKGIDLGGWISQCGNNYNEEHYSSFITEKDIEIIASWGADHVRLPVDYNVVQREDGSFIEEGFAHIDHCIEWCEKNHLKIVLDLHKTCGYVFDDETYCSFFTDEGLQDMFVNLWLEFNRRYGSNKSIAFELLNEVTDPSTAEPWNKIAKRTIAAIRKTNQSTYIIIGGIYNSSIYGLTLLDAPSDENIVFTFHCYNPLIFTHQGAGWIKNMDTNYRISYPLPADDMSAESRKVFGNDFDAEYQSMNHETLSSEFFVKLFDPALKVAEEYNVPLYCGEYGVIELADRESTLRWYQDIHQALEQFDIPRAAWSYKQMDFGIADSLNDTIRDSLTQLL